MTLIFFTLIVLFFLEHHYTYFLFVTLCWKEQFFQSLISCSSEDRKSWCWVCRIHK